METEKLIRHATELAKAFDVELHLFNILHPLVAEKLFLLDIPGPISWPPDLACAAGRRVVSKEITDETSYIVVLHEMGHIIAPCGRLRVAKEAPNGLSHPRERHRWMNLRLTEEEAAWGWARYYALVWTVAMEQVEQSCYATYVRRKEQTR